MEKRATGGTDISTKATSGESVDGTFNPQQKDDEMSKNHCFDGACDLEGACECDCEVCAGHRRSPEEVLTDARQQFGYTNDFGDVCEIFAEVVEALAAVRRASRSPEASITAIKVAENQYAIPAQEETKRAVEETKRFKWRAAIYAPTVLGGIYAMKSCPPTNAQWIAIAIIGVLGTVEGVQALDRYLSNRRPK
jgi:hypothetical protein